jgi:hypothetical protein
MLAMMIARWEITARFGKKEEALSIMRRWYEEVAPQVGWTAENMRILTGSVGAPESAIVTETQVEDLAALNRAWDKLATIGAHAHWSKELEPHIVSGTNRWTIYRVL